MFIYDLGRIPRLWLTDFHYCNSYSNYSHIMFIAIVIAINLFLFIFFIFLFPFYSVFNVFNNKRLDNIQWQMKIQLDASN